MKRILLVCIVMPLLVLLAACASDEEKRDAFMEQARTHAKEGRCPEASQAAKEALELDPAVSEAVLILARCEMSSGKRAEAIVHYRRALELVPDSIESLLTLARTALQDNDQVIAESYAQKAWDLGDRSQELTVIRAGVFMEKGDFAAAKPLLEEVLKANPEDEEALVGLASAYINTDERDKVRDLLTSFLARRPASTTALSLLLNVAKQDKDFALAEECLAKLIDLNPGSEELFMQRAELLALSGKAEELPELMSAYLVQNPGAHRVRLTLITLESSRGQFDRALELIDQAPEKTGALRLGRANILAAAGRVDDCIAELKSIAADPQTKAQAADARLGLADIYLQKNMPDEAMAELNALLKDEPGNAQALLMRGRVHAGMRRIADAITDFETILKADSNNMMAAVALAEAQFAAGNAGLAEAQATGLIQRAPKSEQGHVLLAKIYLAQGMPDAALMTLNLGKANVADKTSMAVMESDILTNLKRYKEAEAVLNQLAKSAGDNKELALGALFRLASVQGAANDHKKAVKTFDRILALEPEAQMAAEGRLRAQLADKQEKAALTFAEKRQKERPDDPAAAMMTGEAALANKNLPKAEKAFLRAVELAPQWDRPLQTMVQIYMATKRQDQALKLCRDTMAKAPDAAQPAMVLAMLHEQKGDLRAAEDVYRNILIKHPDLLPAANSLAFLITRNKPTPERLAEAEELAKKATASKSPSTFDTLGWVQHLLNKNAEAEASLRTAHAGAPDNAIISYRLAVVLAAQNDPAKNTEARDLVKLALKNKNFPLKADAEKLEKKLAAGK